MRQLVEIIGFHYPQHTGVGLAGEDRTEPVHLTSAASNPASIRAKCSLYLGCASSLQARHFCSRDTTCAHRV